MEKGTDNGIQEKNIDSNVAISDSTPGNEQSGLQEANNTNYYIEKRGRNSWPRKEKSSILSGFTSYVRFIWPYLLIITVFFFGALVAGYIWAANFPGMAAGVMEGFSSRFQPLLQMDPLSIMVAIFLNNAFVSLISLVLGLALGILPILFIVFNGYLIGVISYLVAQERGFLFIFLALLPHGILELPMVFLSAAIGLRLGHQVISALLGNETEIKREFIEGLKFYIFWILPLLLLAAIIETFITPLILSFFR